MRLKIKHRFYLLVSILMMVVSLSILFSAVFLFKAGSRKVLIGVSQNLEKIQDTSVAEFNRFTDLADEGIREASGQVAVGAIVNIAKENQASFVNLANKAIADVSDTVAGNIEHQNQLVNQGLAGLLDTSNNSIKEVMRFDQQSQNLLSNMSLMNMAALKTSLSDSIQRLGRVVEEAENSLKILQTLNLQAIDNLSKKIYTELDQTKGANLEAFKSAISPEFEKVKKTTERQKSIYFQRLNHAFQLETKAILEELDLVANKVQFAIQSELESAQKMQSEKIAAVIDTLAQSQEQLKMDFEASNQALQASINELKNNMPVMLRQKGQEALSAIEEQTADGNVLASSAKSMVTEKVQANKSAATAKFQEIIADANAKVSKNLNTITLTTTSIGVVIALVCLSIGFIIAVFMVSKILQPLTHTVDIFKDIAEGGGDLTRRLEVNTNDEMGELAHWFNTFIAKIQSIIQALSKDVSGINASSGDLAKISLMLSQGTDQTTDMVGKLSAASGQFNTNISSVASSMSQTSSNISMVAASAEEMTGTINEIARNTESAHAISSTAVAQADKASQQVSRLGESAQEIGRVLETIAEISEQVNLLALNATIEAARAGEAGKGFAVVANEIKELARGTAQATDEIKNRIEEIQQSSYGTVEQIENITKVVNSVNDIVATIAAAIDEQSATTREMADNVSQASVGISDVNESMVHSTSVVTDITSAIQQIETATSQMATSANNVNGKSGELADWADKIKSMVDRFKV